MRPMPVGALFLFDVGDELFEHFASIANERSVDFYVLVDFGAVNFDVNFAWRSWRRCAGRR